MSSIINIFMISFKEYVMSKQKVNLTEASLFDSPFLFKEMAVLNPNALQKTQSAMQFIKDNNIPGVIIGGMAVSHYTVDRTLTPDVDFLTPDINYVKSILTKEDIDFEPLMSDNGAFSGIMVKVYDTDFLDASKGTPILNQFILDTATTATIGGQQFPIINPHALTIMKFVTGREKDTTDAFNLLPMLRKSEFQTLIKELSGRYKVAEALTAHDKKARKELKDIFSYASMAK